MFDLPPIEPHAQVAIASHGISKGLQQTKAPQLVAVGGAALGAMTAELKWKNVDGADADGEAAISLNVDREVGRWTFSAGATYKARTGDYQPDRDRGAIEMEGEGAVSLTAACLRMTQL